MNPAPVAAAPSLPSRAALRPPRADSLGLGATLAVLVHVGLVAALTVSVRWHDEPPMTVETELWAAVPRVAAAPPPAPEPEPEPRPAATRPAPAPERPTPSSTRAPRAAAAEREQARRDAEIAVERERDRKERERKEAAAREQQRSADAKRRKEQEQKERQAAAEREQRERERERERQAAEDQRRQKEKEREQQARATRERQEKERREREAAEAAEAAERAERLRQEQMRRLTAQLGGRGNTPGATGRGDGDAIRDASLSAAYQGRIKARIRPYIVFSETPEDNPTTEIEVRASSDGTIIGKRIIKRSTNSAWDEAVLRAIDKAAILPRDTDGSMPSPILMTFRRYD